MDTSLSVFGNRLLCTVQLSTLNSCVSALCRAFALALCAFEHVRSRDVHYQQVPINRYMKRNSRGDLVHWPQFVDGVTPFFAQFLDVPDEGGVLFACEQGAHRSAGALLWLLTGACRGRNGTDEIAEYLWALGVRQSLFGFGLVLLSSWHLAVSNTFASIHVYRAAITFNSLVHSGLPLGLGLVSFPGPHHTVPSACSLREQW